MNGYLHPLPIKLLQWQLWLQIQKGLQTIGQPPAIFPDFSVVKEEFDVYMILERVYEALQEKGYNPVNQIVGYLMSGDPTYITSHKNARSIINKVERDEIMEALLENYIDTKLK